ncbi:hypothetical protein RGUI_3235 [Rhodovulum sp. P5]|nr:hypothetical protein RGUI_3235 [Rhodovulum sp. P5]
MHVGLRLNVIHRRPVALQVLTRRSGSPDPADITRRTLAEW